MLIRKYEFMLHDASVYLNFHEDVLFGWCHDSDYYIRLCNILLIDGKLLKEPCWSFVSLSDKS